MSTPLKPETAVTPAAVMHPSVSSERTQGRRQLLVRRKSRGQLTPSHSSSALSALTAAAPPVGKRATRRIRPQTWTRQEKEFASALIEAFKAGLLDDTQAEHGVSMSLFLARQLQCSPMRVQKAFSSALVRTSYAPAADPEPHVVKTTADDLAALRNAFRDSLDNAALLPTKSQGPTVPQPTPASRLAMAELLTPRLTTIDATAAGASSSGGGGGGGANPYPVAQSLPSSTSLVEFPAWLTAWTSSAGGVGAS